MTITINFNFNGMIGYINNQYYKFIVSKNVNLNE